MDGVLRVISGPNVGACFVLGERTRLGRAVDADIQLPETHVSRHHARIVQLETGGFELTDLGSKLGTMVNGAPVRRRRLEPNDIIAIGRCMFSFEFSVGEVTARGFSNKARGFDVLRPTQRLPTVPEQMRRESEVSTPAPPARPRRRTTQRKMPAMGGAPVGRRTPRPATSIELPFAPADEAPKRVIAPPPESNLAGTELLHAILGPEVDAVVSEGGAAANEDSGPKVAAVPTATVVVGSGPLDLEPAARDAALDVLRDVLDYRALRLEELRGGALRNDQRRRYDQLSTRLLVDTHGLPASRRFVRVGCPLPATLTQCDGPHCRTLEVTLEDLSAGGARLCMHDPAVRVGDEVWLAFDLAALFSYGQKVVFRSRVVWTSPRIGATGIMFGGNARFVDTVEAAIATG